MSEQQNVDAVRNVYAAFGRGDLEGILALLDPEVSCARRVRQICRPAGCGEALPRSTSSSDFC